MMNVEFDLQQLDEDKQCLLACYALYSNEEKHQYLQYTASCALIYYLASKKLFSYPLDELLVYDYLGGREYIWESKKFMSDINILRDHGLLMRARLKSELGRDMNAHVCTTKGKNAVSAQLKTNATFQEKHQKLLHALSDAKGNLQNIILEKDGPKLVSNGHKTTIKGFLNPFEENNTEQSSKLPSHQAFYIN